MCIYNDKNVEKESLDISTYPIHLKAEFVLGNDYKRDVINHYSIRTISSVYLWMMNHYGKHTLEK